jgi:hypothetical protein
MRGGSRRLSEKNVKKNPTVQKRRRDKGQCLPNNATFKKAL